MVQTSSETSYRYNHSEKGIKKHKEYNESHKEQKKIRDKKYKDENRELLREKGKKYSKEHLEIIRKNVKIYTKKYPDRIHERKKKYFQTEEGRTYKIRHRHRCRKKDFVPILPNIFPDGIEIDWHHIDGKIFVVPIPKNLHNHGGPNVKKHLEWANSWVEFYYDMNPLDFITDAHSTGQHPLDTLCVSPVE